MTTEAKSITAYLALRQYLKPAFELCDILRAVKVFTYEGKPVMKVIVEFESFEQDDVPIHLRWLSNFSYNFTAAGRDYMAALSEEPQTITREQITDR